MSQPHKTGNITGALQNLIIFNIIRLLREWDILVRFNIHYFMDDLY
jgi:hypothetical protein